MKDIGEIVRHQTTSITKSANYEHICRVESRVPLKGKNPFEGKSRNNFATLGNTESPNNVCI